MAGSATPSRVAALDVLRRLRSGELLDRALDAGASRLEPRDRAWTQELVYGTVRLRGRLDHLLSSFVRSGIDSLEPDVLDVLRLGAYQLLEMDGVPPYAAVSQSVELVRAAGAQRAAGLVNGVLQSLRRRGAEAAFPDPEADPAGHLSTWGAHPRWLVDRWIRRWGVAETRLLVARNNERPELYLRPVGLTVEEAEQRLTASGVAAERVDAFPESLRVPPPGTAADALAAAPGIIQDPAASSVVRYAAVPEGAAVLDLCAAPGGKAIALSDRASLVVAADRSARRMRRVAENVERLGLGAAVASVVADVRDAPFRPADVVLLDAPCTGTGTLRRHPDGRWRVTEVDLAALVELQRELLDAAASLVRRGGLLIYSTCSIEAEENEERVESFLASHPEFTPEAAEGAVDPALTEEGRWLRVLPQRHGVDGAFAARLRRRA